ncbi:MAG: hypothetical protein ACI86M_000682 [Saprospiraceae bacterium]|jgi:hypothetical protein
MVSRIENHTKNWCEIDSSIQGSFELDEILNRKLTEVRQELNVKPPTFWCRNCNERRKTEMNMLTIIAMYFAVGKLELYTHKEHLELKRNWRKYSKENLINKHGKPIDEKKITKHNCN